MMMFMMMRKYEKHISFDSLGKIFAITKDDDNEIFYCF